MPLVNYSSSSGSSSEDDDHDNWSSSTLKRKRDAPRQGTDDDSTAGPLATDLPPLPSKFHDLYAASSRVSARDDPSLHGGRTRAIPHIEGNWPTHLYLEWHPTSSESTHLLSIISQLSGSFSDLGLHGFMTSDLGAPLPLHISLSRAIVLSTDQRGPFLDLVTGAVKESGVRPFNVSFSSLDWVANESKTRYFLVLGLAKRSSGASSHPSSEALHRLLKLCNGAVQQFGQPPLYAEQRDVSPIRRNSSRRSQGRERPRTARPAAKGSRQSARRTSEEEGTQDTTIDYSEHFHVSIGWTLHEPSADVVSYTSTLLEREQGKGPGVEATGNGLQTWRVKLEDVKVKIGNVVTSVELPAKAEEGRGVLGL